LADGCVKFYAKKSFSDENKPSNYITGCLEVVSCKSYEPVEKSFKNVSINSLLFISFSQFLKGDIKISFQDFKS